MIYGLRFNNSPIPYRYSARFTGQRRVWYCHEPECNAALTMQTICPNCKRVGTLEPTGVYGALVGVADNEIDLAMALQQVTDGHRTVLSIERKLSTTALRDTTDGSPPRIWAIYVYDRYAPLDGTHPIYGANPSPAGDEQP